MTTLVEYDDLSTGRILIIGESELPPIGSSVIVPFPERDEIFVSGKVVDIRRVVDPQSGQTWARVIVSPPM